MNLLSVENISKSFGDVTLFENVSFGIQDGQKIALVAKNGNGKTTLLRILTGKDKPDAGMVTVRNNIRISLLEQESNFASGTTLAMAVSQNKRIADALETGNYTSLTDDELTQIGDIKSVCGKLKVDEFTKTTDTCSGGQLKRIALARVLIDDADLLILDEPTNHLDIEMIEWLEYYLNTLPKTFLLVTHDRYFLDNICEEILELEDKTLYKHRGNYFYYLEKRAARIESQQASIDKARNLYRKELEWMRRMPKARGTKAKARQDAFYDTQKEAKKRIDEKEVDLNININRIGTKILELHKIGKSVGEKLLINNFSYTFKRGEKIGIVGPNGAGKSTLLNLIMGKTEPDKGKIVIGETIQFGYFEQQGIKFSDDKRVIEVVKEIADYIPLTGGKKITATQLLERFLFIPEKHYQYVGKLSGGEKRRLYLLTVLMKNPNFLILDEPTNDLDTHTLTALEDYLENFEGCVLLVTHDRFFMDRLVDHVFVFGNNGEIKDIIGNYTAYRDSLKASEKERKAEKEIQIKEAKENKANPVKLSFKEKFEFEQLEKEIPELEKNKKELETILMEGKFDFKELNNLTAQLGEITKSLDEKSLRWLELSEKVV